MVVGFGFQAQLPPRLRILFTLSHTEFGYLLQTNRRQVLSTLVYARRPCTFFVHSALLGRCCAAGSRRCRYAAAISRCGGFPPLPQEVHLNRGRSEEGCLCRAPPTHREVHTAGHSAQFEGQRAVGRCSAPHGETLLLLTPQHSKTQACARARGTEARALHHQPAPTSPRPHPGFPMSAHLSRLRLFQRPGFGIGFTVKHWHTSPRTRSPSSRHPRFTHYSFSRVHLCVVVSLVHTSLGSSYLIAHILHNLPPRAKGEGEREREEKKVEKREREREGEKEKGNLNIRIF
jgi:hypothetical protein